MSAEAWIQLIATLIGVGSVWGAIRADIKNIHNSLHELRHSTDDAHHRIDEILLKGPK